MASTTFEGQLEIDHESGTVYFHKNNGETQLRICGLGRVPVPVIGHLRMMDVRVSNARTSWRDPLKPSDRT
jgi:hypothetical protein